MLPYRDVGRYADTPAFCSEYYTWFQELGYPTLDIVVYEDGEWSIIEMLTGPHIPSEVKFRPILSGMRNTAITFGFVKKYVEFLDITKGAYLEAEELKSAKILKENDDLARHRRNIAERAVQIINRHDHLKERIAKFGLQEALPWHVAKHIPPRAFKPNFKSEKR